MNIHPEEKQRIEYRLAPLAAMFPNWKPDDLTTEAYVVALADVDPLSLEAAILHLLSQPLKFMPSAGEIRHASFDLQAGNGGPPTAYEAWGIVGTAIKAGAGYPVTGVYPAPDVHPLVEKTVNYIGGWRHLAASENYTADRARFIEAYNQVREREVEQVRMLPQVREQMKALADGLSMVNARRLEDHQKREEQNDELP